MLINVRYLQLAGPLVQAFTSRVGSGHHCLSLQSFPHSWESVGALHAFSTVWKWLRFPAPDEPQALCLQKCLATALISRPSTDAGSNVAVTLTAEKQCMLPTPALAIKCSFAYPRHTNGTAVTYPVDDLCSQRKEFGRTVKGE